jgi:ABC-type nitrate/sulfonate/bicarbonate transport system substrate-binding protein
VLPSRRTFLGWSGAALAGLTLAACSSDPSGSTSKTSTLTIIHANGSPLLLWSVSYLAEDLGYYKDEGLTVQRTYLGGGPPAAASLIAGSGTEDLSSPGELLRLTGKGQKLKVLMAHTNTEPEIFLLSKAKAAGIGVTADSDQQTRQAALGRIKNGKYGITAVGSETDGLTRMALKQAGVNPDQDAQLLPLQSGANCLAALANGRIDGFMSLSPVAETATLQTGAVPLLQNAKGDINGGQLLQGQCVQVRGSDVDANRDMFAAMIRADVRALHSAVQDPDSARDLLRKTRFSSVPVSVWPAAWEHTAAAWGSPYIAAASMTGWINAGLVAGVTSASEINVSDVIDMTFVDQAVKSLGWKPTPPPS